MRYASGNIDDLNRIKQQMTMEAITQGTAEHIMHHVMINFILNGEMRFMQFDFTTINEQISNFAQTYPTNLKASSNEALLFMRRYRFANCSCFSCCFKDAYPSSNVQ